MGRNHESLLRKLERELALTIACAILLAGCGKLVTEPPAAIAPSEELVGSMDSMGSTLSSIGIMEDLSFEGNKSAAVTIEYDGTETSVEVVDAKGLIWQLNIPPNAVRDKCTIIFTPLAAIKGEYKKEGLSGILMEPDGLEFIKPATLTVTGPDTDKLLFFTGTQNGKNYTYQPAEKLENGVKLSVNHFSSEVASDVLDDPEVYEKIKESLPEIEKLVRDTMAKPIQVPDIMEIPLECYKGIPEVVDQQIQEWLLPEFTSVMWCGILLQFYERHGDEDGVNKVRKLWLDIVKRFFEKEKAYYDKYQGQPDKFAVEPYFLSRPLEIAINSGGAKPPVEAAAIYADYLSRKEKWAYESAKYSIDKIRNHNYKYMKFVIECMENLSYDQNQEMWEEFNKALTFKLKIKIGYTQIYSDDGPGIITSEGEGKMVPNWSGKNMFLSGDINISTTSSGFYDNFKYSPTEYKISAQVRNWDPCKTQSSDIWVSNLGLEEEELEYNMDGTYMTFSEVLIWDCALDFFEKELEEGFHVKLNNFEEIAVAQSFSGKDETLDITLDVLFELVHTPQ